MWTTTTFNFNSTPKTATTATPEEEPTESVFGTPWYIPDIEESSVVRSFKFREVEEDRTLIVVQTHAGKEYSYEIATDVAKDFYTDLAQGLSPGSIWNELRDYTRNAPVAEKTDSVTVTGNESSIALIRAHARNLGLTVA